jgi:hypothetical protein
MDIDSMLLSKRVTGWLVWMETAGVCGSRLRQLPE